VAEPGVLAQAAEDVLHVDDRVIDHLAQRDREAPEGEGIDSEPQQIEGDDASKERERDRRQGDCRGPRIREKDEQDACDEDRSQQEGAGDVAESQVDEL
jgi:hypothetical protein